MSLESSYQFLHDNSLLEFFNSRNGIVPFTFEGDDSYAKT